MGLDIKIESINNKFTTLVKVKASETVWDGYVWTHRELGEAVGESRRDKIDTFDKEIGFELALGRALKTLGSRIEKRTNGTVKHRDDIREIQAKQKKEKAKKEPVYYIDELIQGLFKTPKTVKTVQEFWEDK